MHKKYLLGIFFGIIAGIIDVTPMIIQKLSWDANISAFVFWIIAGFIIASSELKLHPIIKGVLISGLLLLPVGILVAWKEPKSLVPMSIMMLILGSVLGIAIEKYAAKK